MYAVIRMRSGRVHTLESPPTLSWGGNPMEGNSTPKWLIWTAGTARHHICFADIEEIRFVEDRRP